MDPKIDQWKPAAEATQTVQSAPVPPQASEVQGAAEKQKGGEMLTPIDPDSPESPERIHRTKEALDKLVEAANGSSHPFRRDIEKVEYVADRVSQNVGGPLLVEQRVPVKTGDENLHTIDLWNFPNTDSDAAYRMSLSFVPEGQQQGSQLPGQLMLSIESPVDLGFRFGIADQANAMAAGVNPQGRRLQDFLYTPGADSVPVREADFTYVYSYRPVGKESSYEATKGQMDVMLGLLADAHVMQAGQKGPKAAELVPQLRDLVTSPSQPAE